MIVDGKRMQGFWRTCLCCGGAAVLLYAVTCQQGVAWQDSGKRQLRILLGDFYGWDGIALAHPLYIGMARCWLAVCSFLENPFWSTNLFSAAGMGAAAGLLAGAAVLATGRRAAGWATALVFGLAHMPWWMGTITEIYGWGIAFHALEWCVLALIVRGNAQALPRKYHALALWCVLGFTNGLHLSLENAALLNLPVYGVVWLVMLARKRVAWWGLPAMGAAWCVGAAWWLALVAASMAGRGFWGGLQDGLFGYAYMAQVLGKKNQFNTLWLANMAVFAFNFFNPLWLAAACGWAAWWRQRGRCIFSARGGMALVFGGLLAIHGVFFVRYPVADQATFAIPTVALLALAGGAGVARLLGTARLRWWQAAGLATLTPVLYAVAAAVLVPLYDAGTLPRRPRELPFRNEIRYWALPWKAGERSAELFTQAVRRQFAHQPGAVLWADITAVTTLQAAQVAEGWSLPRVVDYHAFPDKTADEILTFYLECAREGRFYVVSPVKGYAPANVLERMDFEPDGVVFRAVPKE